MLTSIKVSMLSIRAWARPMMNWLTHAIAWDLRDGEVGFQRGEKKGAEYGQCRPGAAQPIHTDLILGLQCLKNCRNLGIMMLSGLFRASLSSNSEESSQIFCNAPKDPWKKQRWKKKKGVKSKALERRAGSVLVGRYPDLTSVVVLRVEKVTQLRQQFGPRLQLSFRGDGCDQDA